MRTRRFRDDKPLVRVAPAYNFYQQAEAVKARVACRLAVAASVAALAACASTPPPTDKIASARTMVTQAQSAASKDAPLEVHEAQMKLARAEDAMQRGDNEIARRLAEQAEVDAKLAWTSAENARVQRAAAEVDRGIQTLREELERRKQ